MDFYSEFRKLVYSRPHNALNSRAVENCAYGDFIYRSKNIYLSYFLMESEDCYYSEYLNRCRDCIDCAYLSACELCYECLDCTGIYDGGFLQDCHNSSECSFCYDCINCKNCFGSFGLRQQQFCIFNKQYSEENYYRKVVQLRKNPPAKTIEILKSEFDKHPRLFARQLKGGENSFGDYIYFSKNCFNCFNVRNLENAAYVSEIMNPEIPSSDCVDCTFASGIELCYDALDSNLCTNCSFIKDCFSCADTNYAVNCYNCRNCFGCVYLENKEYYILNRPFSREEYVIAAAKIKEELKTTRVYGKALGEILI